MSEELGRRARSERRMMNRRATHKVTEILSSKEAAERLRPKDVPATAEVVIVKTDARTGLEVEWTWTESHDDLEG